MRAAILSAAETSHAAVLADRADSIEGQVLAAIARLNAGNEPIRVAEIAAALSGEGTADSDQPITARLIGKMLRRLGLALYKRNGVSVLAPSQAKRLAALYALYGIEPTATPEGLTQMLTSL